MKKKVAKILFSVALLIFVGLGFLILKENSRESTTYAPLCKKDIEYTFPKNLQILWNDAKYFVSYDLESKSIQLNTWTFLEHQFNYSMISHLGLHCEKPDYNCIAKNLNIKIRKFTPPYGVLSVQSNNKENIIPFSWDSKKTMALGSPLQLCGQNLTEIHKGKYFWLQNNLFFYDYERNIIGQFNMSILTGSTFASAPIDAQRVLTIVNEGFIEVTTCDKKALNLVADPYHIQTEKDHVLIYKPNASGVAYSFKTDFSPIFKTTAIVSKTISDSEHNELFFTDSKNIFKLSYDNLKETIIDNTVENSDILKLNQNQSDSSVYSQMFQKMVALNPYKIVGSDSLDIMDFKNHTGSLVKGAWGFFQNELFYKYVGVLNSENLFYFSQPEESTGRFTTISCSP